MIACGVVLGQADVFIHIEGDDVFERYLFCRIELNQLFIHTEG
jgi:hypothetical protein